METVFLTLLNMSIASGWLILAVLALRALLPKAPKAARCALWALAGIRLACPFSPESALSLIPSAQTVPAEILYAEAPAIHSGIGALNQAVNPILSNSLAPAAGASVNPMQVVVYAASIAWAAGVAAMLLYAAVSSLRLRRRVAAALPCGEGVWLCDGIASPFILGVIRPRIYLPSDIAEEQIAYVCAHERAHLARRDHWWKPLGFALLAAHWFNPLVWLAYWLFCRDMELACDARVVKEMSVQDRKAYSGALLACSAAHRLPAACPLAFGEVGVRARIKSVLHYKKPAFWVVLCAVVACVAVAVCFLTSPKAQEAAALPDVAGRSYRAAEVVYEAPQYSMVAPTDLLVCVSEDERLLAKGAFFGGESWRDLGPLEEFALTEENFDRRFDANGQGGWRTGRAAAAIRRENACAWRLTGQMGETTVRCDLLQQRGGALYFAYGYESVEDRDTSIRWLYALSAEPAATPGILAISGGNSVPVVVYPAGTPVRSVKDSVYWLNVDADSEALAPFAVYCSGYEQHGWYSICDAETFEPLEFFLPSGLSETTYILQNAQPGRAYLVTLQTDPQGDGRGDLLCFGVIAPDAGIASVGGADGPASVTQEVSGFGLAR